MKAKAPFLPSGGDPEASTWGLDTLQGSTLQAAVSDDSFLKRLSGVSSGESEGLPCPSLGARFGGEDGLRFELLERIGAGALGIVFRASDRHLERDVAIKFIVSLAQSERHELAELARLEAVASARLAHENVVRVFDLTRRGRLPAVIMEHLRGYSLGELLRREHVSPMRAIGIMKQLAAGLSHAHERGIIHRDLKPTNVFVVENGPIKILDFGMALISWRPAELHDSAAAQGTPSYMAPEQWQGSLQDARTDLWAAGVILFEMLAGRRPYEGTTMAVLRDEICSPRPVPCVRDQRNDVPDSLDALVARLLVKDAQARLGTAGELLDELGRIEQVLASAEQSGVPKSSGRSTVRAERRQVTLLACRLALPAAGAPANVEDLADIADAFEQECANVVREHGGTILSSLSGEVLACFGYPIGDECAAERAVCAALWLTQSGRGGLAACEGNLPQAPRTGNEPVKDAGSASTVRVGLHTDIAIVTAMEGQPPSVKGNAPALARQLAAAAPAGGVAISANTQILVRSSFVIDALSKGVSDDSEPDLPFYFVRGRRDLSSRFDRSRRYGVERLFGRSTELAWLTDRWRHAESGRGLSVVMSGEAGIGKSRLAEEFIQQLGSDARVMVCQCWPGAGSSPLQPIVDLLRCFLEERTGQPSFQALEAMTLELGAAGALILPVVSSLLGFPLSPADAKARVESGKLFDGLARLLLLGTGDATCLLLVEDVHWADPSTLELLRVLCSRIGSRRCMVLMTARLELDVRSLPPSETLGLARLSREESVQFIREFATGHALDADISEQLAERSCGVPLVIGQLADALIQSWSEDPQSARDSAPSSPGIPSTLHDLLRAQLDRLDHSELELAQMAAVLGRRFQGDLLTQLSGLPSAVVNERLNCLVAARVLQPSNTGERNSYQFHHILVQEAAYDSLPRKHLSEYHAKAARVLRAMFASKRDFEPELIAHHYERAGEAHQAIGYLYEAGRLAIQRSGYVEAIVHFERALALVHALPAQTHPGIELDLLLGLGHALIATRGYTDAQVERTYARAALLASEKKAGEAQSLVGLWLYHFARAHFDTAQGLARRLAAVSSPGEADFVQLMASRFLGTTLFAMGEMAPARDCFKSVLARYALEQHASLGIAYGLDPAVAALSYAAWAYELMGEPDEAANASTSALSLAERLAHPHTEAFACSYAATFFQVRGDASTCRMMAERALELSSRREFTFWRTWATIMRGWALAAEGDATGVGMLRQGVEQWESCNAVAGLTYFCSILAERQLAVGQVEDARLRVGQGIRLAQEHGEHYYAADLYRLEGLIALASESTAAVKIQAARASFAKSLASARACGTRLQERKTLAELGRIGSHGDSAARDSTRH